MAPHVLPGFDPEFATYIEGKLADAGIPVSTGVKVTGLEGEDGKVKKVLTDKRGYKCDLVVLSAGIRPNTAFLQGHWSGDVQGHPAHQRAGTKPTIPTSTPWATAPWCANAITGKAAWSPMGSTANIEGRMIAENISGKTRAYRGSLGTAVCQLPGPQRRPYRPHRGSGQG